MHLPVTLYSNDCNKCYIDEDPITYTFKCVLCGAIKYVISLFETKLLNSIHDRDCIFEI